MCSGSGGYEPGKLILEKQKSISKLTWHQFKEKLDEIGFWGMATKEKSMGNDGSEWILEGVVNDKYHVVDRWTPKSLSDYYQCCDYLLKLTDIKIPADRKY
ncbi:hypothetical protein JN11_00127 [Mucilaginibacter frigoritolerans]|jgi:hypothetical protein|uniref:Uncharacterized protein n=1 Tax=Mucilaginibacter frigoritolerans TaxID=652788 RepID=A0A562UFP4_9SPHI|nr:hypothetical protein [Mucilaginibacter frigoritolerans]TWJ04419.1 hypothetical protein JN11_00127 [Mucilaginibacter frigoritolerans]